MCQQALQKDKATENKEKGIKINQVHKHKLHEYVSKYTKHLLHYLQRSCFINFPLCYVVFRKDSMERSQCFLLGNKSFRSTDRLQCEYLG